MDIKVKVVIGFVALIVVYVASMMFLGNDPDVKAKSFDRDVIAQCWTNQGKKSLEPSAARFIAGSCEKLEADFQAKWKVSP